MAQHDMILADAAGLALRTDLNAALAALVSLNSGAAEPPTKYAGMLWLDTSVSNGALKMRNQANTAWVPVQLAGTPAVTVGLALGNVVTTANIASNNTDAAMTNFPVGTKIWVHSTALIARTSGIAPRLYPSAVTMYSNTGTEAALAGAWRSRGVVTVAAGAYFHFAERTG